MNTSKLITRVTTPEFIASFPHILRARVNDTNGKTEYSVNMLFDSKADLSALKSAYSNAAKNLWGDKIPSGLRSPFRKGDEKDYEGYAGKIFITAKTQERPGVVDEDVQPIIDETLIYSGVVCRATINAYAYDQAGNKGVSFFLCNVQKLRDGKRIGGGKSAEMDFQKVPKTESAPDQLGESIPGDFDQFKEDESPEGVQF